MECAIYTAIKSRTGNRQQTRATWKKQDGFLDKFDELRLLTKDNRPVVELSFADVYALWWLLWSESHSDPNDPIVANFRFVDHDEFNIVCHIEIGEKNT